MSRSRKFGLILLTGGWTLLIGAIVALIGNGLLECGWMTPERARMVWMILEAAMILLPVLQYICGILSEKLFRERSVARQVRIWEQEKEKAHRAAAEGKPSHISHLYRSKVLLGVIYLLVLFTGNMATLLFLPSADNAFITGFGQYFIPYNLAVCGLILGRILTSVEIRPFKGMITLKRRSFRYLYKMARKAERKCRVHGRIRITMTADRGVSIATYGIGFRRENYLSVDGVSLDSLTEEELYSVFLHEFAHRRVKKSLDPRDEVWGRVFISHSHTGIISRLEYWLVFYFCHSLFFYLDCFQKVANEYVEELADQLAVRLGDPDAFASALVKLHAYNRYLLIAEDYREENGMFYRNAEVQRAVFTKDMDCFRRCFAENYDRWMKSFAQEIPERYNSHPILVDRLKNISVSLRKVKAELPDRNEDSPYRKDCNTFLSELNALMGRDYQKQFPRRTQFEGPLARVKQFHSNGNRCFPEETGQILSDLEKMRKYGEAEELCRSMIADSTIQDIQRVYALLYLGKTLLNHENPEGMEYLYRVSDCSDALAEDALASIRAFCSRNGMRSAYEKCWRRTEEFGQYWKDVAEKRVTLQSKDRLSAVDAEDAVRYQLLQYLLKIAERDIEAVYAVRKDFGEGPEDYAIQMFPLFKNRVSPQRADEIMSRFFYYKNAVPMGNYYAFLPLSRENVRILDKNGNCCIFREGSRK